MKSRRPRALLLDYGGVLMRTRSRALRVAWDTQLQLPRGSVERIVHGSEAWQRCQLGQLNEKDYWQSVARELQLSPEALPQFRSDYFAADQLDRKAISLLRSLRTQGIPVALLSNESRSLPARLAQLGIADLFSPLLVSSYLGCLKPEPAAYRAALALMGKPAEVVLFIDDRAENVGAAISLGMQGVQFQEGKSLSRMIWQRFNDADQEPPAGESTVFIGAGCASAAGAKPRARTSAQKRSTFANLISS